MVSPEQSQDARSGGGPHVGLAQLRPGEGDGCGCPAARGRRAGGGGGAGAGGGGGAGAAGAPGVGAPAAARAAAPARRCLVGLGGGCGRRLVARRLRGGLGSRLARRRAASSAARRRSLLLDRRLPVARRGRPRCPASVGQPGDERGPAVRHGEAAVASACAAAARSRGVLRRLGLAQQRRPAAPGLLGPVLEDLGEGRARGVPLDAWRPSPPTPRRTVSSWPIIAAGSLVPATASTAESPPPLLVGPGDEPGEPVPLAGDPVAARGGRRPAPGAASRSPARSCQRAAL